MAMLDGLSLAQNHPHLWKKVRGIYTYGGQPMVVDSRDEELCRYIIGKALFRHVYYNDIFPHLPPLSFGVFDHVGEEHRYHPRSGWELQTPSWWSRGHVTQVPALLITAPFALFDALLLNFPLVKNIKMFWSFMDHSPVGYMATLDPEGCTKPKDTLTHPYLNGQ